MPEPTRTCGNVQEKLGAYLDGELDPRSQAAVQAHLAACPACQAELDELQDLSLMLRAAPQPEFTPALDFKAQLVLQLPRDAAREPLAAPARGSALPWLAPVLVLGGWIFVQLTLGLTSLVGWANNLGLLGQSANWAASGPQQMQWYSALTSTLGLNGFASLKFFNDAGVFTSNLLAPVLIQIVVALVYWGVLALVWRGGAKAMWASLTTR